MTDQIERPANTVLQWASKHEALLDTVYATQGGVSLVAKSEELLASTLGQTLRGRVQLVFTSPPFPLNRKKRYDNLQGEAYKNWLKGYAAPLRELLTRDGSIVIEMGNAWEPENPVMSTLALESLLEFKRAGELYLCQEFIWHNPAKLPTPAQWVAVERIRVKDSFTRLWWLSPVPKPKADNRRVLTPYSSSMKSLLRRRRYNAGKRPSGHVIGDESFFTDNGGAIPPSFLSIPEADSPREALPDNVLIGANTMSSDGYIAYCDKHGLDPHPARMPVDLAKFFVKLCTEPGDVVLDPFAGSNTTGLAADSLGRQWIGVEANRDYAASGEHRFEGRTIRTLAEAVR